MVVRVDQLAAEFSAQDLGRAVGDDLVGVHVGRGPGTGLEDVDDEVRVESAVHDFAGGLFDGVGNVLFKPAELLVDLSGRELDQAQRTNESARKPAIADREVQHGALRLSPVVCGGWDLHRPHGIPFDACLGRVLAHRSSLSWVEGSGTLDSTEFPRLPPAVPGHSANSPRGTRQVVRRGHSGPRTAKSSVVRGMLLV